MAKRFFDIVSSLIGLLILSPIIVVFAVLVKIKLGSPILFEQERPGLGGASFFMYKFRSMTDAKDSSGTLLPDEQRLTRFGRFLRSSSIDELPGLWNVLKGDMSVVGPRPLLMEYLPLYNEEQRRRHDVKPGLTGWAQVNGRNALSWEDKFELDVFYVDNKSIFFDLKIIALTVFKVIKRSGISHDGEATMHKFSGTSDVREKN